MEEYCPKCGKDGVYFNTLEYECPHCGHTYGGIVEKNEYEDDSIPCVEICPYCNSNNTVFLEYEQTNTAREYRHRLYKCNNCNRPFEV